MYWTLELASKLEDAPWPATKDELVDYAQRSGAPLEVIENLMEIEDEGDVYESMEDKLVNGLCPVNNLRNQRFAQSIIERSFWVVSHCHTYAARFLVALDIISAEEEVIPTVSS